MKVYFLAIAILSLLVFRVPDIRAQSYGPYWEVQYQQYLQHQQYLQWQQYLEYLRQNDPYYELHAMHYQLYLRPYPPHQIYVPCCYAVGIPVWSTPTGRVPHAAKGRKSKAGRRR